MRVRVCCNLRRTEECFLIEVAKDMRAAARIVRKNLGYAGAAASVGLALLLTYTLGTERVGLEPLFFAAVMVSAFFWGLGPGLLATALAGFCSAYFFLD